MSGPIEFTSHTARFNLPLLFPGQAQKEFYINEAHALIDLLVHPLIEEEVDAPPISPGEGQCWLVSQTPTGEWIGHEGEIAGWVGGGWLFLLPRHGVRLHDRTTGQIIFYANGWHRVSPPVSPAGGGTVDAEARETIGLLIEALRNAGIFAAL